MPMTLTEFDFTVLAAATLSNTVDLGADYLQMTPVAGRILAGGSNLLTCRFRGSFDAVTFQDTQSYWDSSAPSSNLYANMYVSFRDQRQFAFSSPARLLPLGMRYWLLFTAAPAANTTFRLSFIAP